MIIIVYQIVTKPLTSKIISEEICPVCEKKNCLELTLYMRYIAMGIPLFGMGRHTGVVCTNCGNVLKNPHSSIFAKKKYSNTVAAAIKDIRANHKRTLWQLLYPWSIWFVLPVLILILFAYGSIIKERQNDNAKKYAELINNPQTGDIYKTTWYENRLSEGVLVRVMRINGDTLYIVKSKKGIPFSYVEEDWKKLSEKSAAFDSKEYKIMNFNKLKEANFGDLFMYSEDKNNNFPIFLGSILNSKSEMALDFETIERKK
jgi:hypothetical protein